MELKNADGMSQEAVSRYPAGWLSLSALRRQGGGEIGRKQLMDLIQNHELCSPATAERRIRAWVKAGTIQCVRVFPTRLYRLTYPT